MASLGAVKMEQDIFVIAPWGNMLILTGLATSMAVNLLGTGLMVFKILNVFWKYNLNATLVERILELKSAMGEFRYILFVIMESGMALFAIQLVRIVFTSTGPVAGRDLVIGIHEMLNVIIRSVHFYFFCNDNYPARVFVTKGASVTVR